MSFYRERILPHLLNLSMRHGRLAAYRRRLVPAAEGRVLEIGIGSGLNLPFYTDRVESLLGLDPSQRLLAMADRESRRRGIHTQLLDASAESIPLEDGSIDTVVITWTLCSIPDPHRAMAEIHRVLRPGGRLLFVEHGRAETRRVVAWQDRLTPVWKRVAGGCHLNRPIAELIRSGNLDIERLETGYMKGPRPLTFMYEGSARRPRRPG